MPKQDFKILYLITKSNYGGAQKYVLELAVAAKEAGHTVRVACGGTGEAGAALGLLADKLTAHNIPISPIQNFLRNMSIFQDILAFFEVWKIIRKYRPDVLHVTSSKAGGIGALAGRLSRVPRIIFTSHGLTIDEVWRPRWQRILIYISTWITLRLSHHNIMINTETTVRAKQMPGLKNRVSLIKNGVAPINFLDKKAARAALAPDVPQKAIWIGGMGELHTNKNWPAAIMAMSSLPPKTHLVIIGAGEEHLKLEQLITDKQLQGRVHLLGYVDGAQYLKAFDIFILPSLKEGLPYVLLEAGLAGLPIVASDLPGNQDIIETGETGFLVSPTPKLLGTTLEMLIRDEGMRRRLGTAIYESCSKEFSIKSMFSRTLALYSSNKSDAR